MNSNVGMHVEAGYVCINQTRDAILFFLTDPLREVDPDGVREHLDYESGPRLRSRHSNACASPPLATPNRHNLCTDYYHSPRAR